MTEKGTCGQWSGRVTTTNFHFCCRDNPESPESRMISTNSKISKIWRCWSHAAEKYTDVPDAYSVDVMTSINPPLGKGYEFYKGSLRATRSLLPFGPVRPSFQSPQDACWWTRADHPSPQSMDAMQNSSGSRHRDPSEATRADRAKRANPPAIPELGKSSIFFGGEKA